MVDEVEDQGQITAKRTKTSSNQRSVKTVNSEISTAMQI